MNIGFLPHFKGYKLKTVKRYFKNGLKFNFTEVSLDNNFFHIDFFIQNGMKSKKMTPECQKSFDVMSESNKQVLIREEPILRMLSDRKNWNRLSWNSFFCDEGIHPFDQSKNRWKYLSKQYNIKVHKYERRGDFILFNLQQKKDAALNKLNFGGEGYHNFIINTIENILLTTDRKILLRPHPIDLGTRKVLYKIYKNNPRILFSNNSSLYDDLNQSWCMITYNSTSSVESILYGTHTICLDPSAVGWEVSGHTINDIEQDLSNDRSVWLQKIAYMQFHNEELKTDTYVWDILKQCNPNLTSK